MPVDLRDHLDEKSLEVLKIALAIHRVKEAKRIIKENNPAEIKTYTDGLCGLTPKEAIKHFGELRDKLLKEFNKKYRQDDGK